MRSTTMIPPGLFTDEDTPAFQEYAKAAIDQEMDFLRAEAEQHWEFLSNTVPVEWQARQEYRSWWRERLKDLVSQLREGWLYQGEIDLTGITSDDHRWDVARLDDEKEVLREQLERYQKQLEAAVRRAEQAERRAAQMERHAEDLYWRNQTMQLTLQTWEAPSPCECGAISYEITCRVCHRPLRGDSHDGRVQEG